MLYRTLLAALLLAACDDGGAADPAHVAPADADARDPDSATPDAAPPDAAAPDAAVIPIDRSHLTDLGTAPLDYADPALWACRPGNDPNECDVDLDGTQVNPDGSREIVQRERHPDPPFDCFYVYPTVTFGSGNVTSFADISPVLDPLLSQGAPFRTICEVYAPLYRQTALGVGDRDLAYGDVAAAFDHYMEHLNRGRRFVLISHSQGTFMLTRLVAERIDDDPDLRAQMISALLIGGAVTVAEGQRTGGSFQNVPACAEPGETGCVVAYNLFAAEAPPEAGAVFGRTPNDGQQVLCSPVPALARNPGRLRGSYLPLRFENPIFAPDGEFDPDFTTPFALYRDFFRAECVHRDGFSYMEITADPAPGDTRPVPPYRSARTEAIGFGLHVADFNLPFDDLVEIVRLQAGSPR